MGTEGVPEQTVGRSKVFWCLFFVAMITVWSVVYAMMTVPVIMKPAVYLYPEETTMVSVNLTFDGDLTFTDPPYENGWEIVAHPNGTLEGGYPYLFYEGRLRSIEMPVRGWCVQYENVGQWMQDTLPVLGLSGSETRDFMEYWMVKLPSAEYYAIRVLSNASLHTHLKLDIRPSPDTLIRVILIFSPLLTPIRLNPPTLNTPQRSGFTVVEWGGFVIAEPLHLVW
jgi:hypothetical protein